MLETYNKYSAYYTCITAQNCYTYNCQNDTYSTYDKCNTTLTPMKTD